jgi:hypothetical protein
MTLLRTGPSHRPRRARTGAAPSGRAWERSVVGGFYLVSAGVHLGLVAADPQTYRGFADAGLFGFVRHGWHDVFMQHPAFWGLCVMAGELTLGVLLLLGGRPARVGWVGVIAFHVLLMLFGFGFWLYAVPALLVLVVLMRRDQAREAAGRTA